MILPPPFVVIIRILSLRNAKSIGEVCFEEEEESFSDDFVSEEEVLCEEVEETAAAETAGTKTFQESNRVMLISVKHCEVEESPLIDDS